MAVAPEGEVPIKIRRFLRSPVTHTRAVALLGFGFSDATLFAIQLAWEIGRPVHLGRNYVNPTTTWKKLVRRYPSWRKTFVPDALAKAWVMMPPRREVPRTHLNHLLEWVQMGREGSEVDEEPNPTAGPWPQVDPSNGPEVGGTWKKAETLPPLEPVPDPPILPELETLWDYVERSPRQPALLIIDSIDALSAHYGIEEQRLIDAIQKDLVDPGFASAIFTCTRSDKPTWLASMDGVLRWTPVPSLSRAPHWLLTIEYLVGRVVRPRQHVMRFEDGRLVSCASGDDMVMMLDRLTQRPRLKTIPAEVKEFLAGREDVAAIRQDSQSYFI